MDSTIPDRIQRMLNGLAYIQDNAETDEQFDDCTSLRIMLRDLQSSFGET